MESKSDTSPCLPLHRCWKSHVTANLEILSASGRISNTIFITANSYMKRKKHCFRPNIMLYHSSRPRYCKWYLCIIMGNVQLFLTVKCVVLARAQYIVYIRSGFFGKRKLERQEINCRNHDFNQPDCIQVTKIHCGQMSNQHPNPYCC